MPCCRVLAVDRLLAYPPLPSGLVNPNLNNVSSSCRPLYHKTPDRGAPGAFLTGDFGETSNIIITASEMDGVVIRDLRVCQDQWETFLNPVDIPQLKLSITRELGLPPRTLRYACFGPDYRDALIMTESSLFFVDRRFTREPR
eukprot:Gregarina_sp_Poly_1__74@NODE_1017_length_5352_cov_48_087228_g709_i0_p4_GENE_NODE_1017_length_5352_cov_48_087228_g709_i0NODE_1017_length_5352_cov_48_087228_g709_i0_p4_ORF_typecomplete_len143_score2_00_NODE_1017_length_5352_cov_48_087228_g709_i0292720